MFVFVNYLTLDIIKDLYRVAFLINCNALVLKEGTLHCTFV